MWSIVKPWDIFKSKKNRGKYFIHNNNKNVVLSMRGRYFRTSKIICMLKLICALIVRPAVEWSEQNLAVWLQMLNILYTRIQSVCVVSKSPAARRGKVTALRGQKPFAGALHCPPFITQRQTVQTFPSQIKHANVKSRRNATKNLIFSTDEKQF